MVLYFAVGDIMQYLTVGTNKIVDELFKEVQDTGTANLKPCGGLWLTKYMGDNYNEWVEFIIDEPTTFFYKSRNYSMWEQPCSLVTLREDAKILNLDSKSKLDYLREKYPLDEYKFSYEIISKLYDGIFIDMYHLLYDISDSEIRQRIFKFGVNSLLLFNLGCIDYYQPGIVSIEPFNYEYGMCELPNYKINIEPVKRKILSKKHN